MQHPLEDITADLTDLLCSLFSFDKNVRGTKVLDLKGLYFDSIFWSIFFAPNQWYEHFAAR